MWKISRENAALIDQKRRVSLPVRRIQVTGYAEIRAYYAIYIESIPAVAKMTQKVIKGAILHDHDDDGADSISQFGNIHRRGVTGHCHSGAKQECLETQSHLHPIVRSRAHHATPSQSPSHHWGRYYRKPLTWQRVQELQ